MTQYLVESQESALTPLLGGFDDDTDVIQSLDRHVPSLAVQNRRPALTPL